MNPFYVWTRPAFNTELLDHTWVTNYDSRQYAYPTIDMVKAAGIHYWFCCGDFHPTGTLIAQGLADLELMKLLVEPNVGPPPPARGTIVVYGHDGVCHQVANQILYAASPAPVTVSGAKGYWESCFLYDTYGLEKPLWESKLRLLELVKSKMVDEFHSKAHGVLAQTHPNKLDALVALRTVHPALHAARASSGVDLNASNQATLDQAAKLLGPDHYKAIFGAAPGAKINLVDPAIAASLT